MAVITIDPLPRFTGKKLEVVVVARLKRLEKDGVASIGRYGVQANVVERRSDGMTVTQLRSSYPDFEGSIAPNGRQVIFDAKVCSQASFDLNKYRESTGKSMKRLQLTHMYRRSRVGAICFFLIHWNERQLKTRNDSAATYAFPVWSDHPFWEAFERGEEKSINRQHCEEHAVDVRWDKYGAERTLRPNVLEATVGIDALRHVKEV